MYWVHAFELLCYVITTLLIVDIFRKKLWRDFYLFISGAIAGFSLELLAVRVTDIYHYNPGFYVNVGVEPYQFPFFGGLMWGGVTVCALRLAEKLKLPPLWTALASGWLVVTMDLFLDVAAIRLDGGFWVWEGRPITLDITHHMFMSVIWVNFLGYMFETPAMIYLTLRSARKRTRSSVWKNLLYSVGIGFAGVAFVGVASALSLLLDSVTNEWFSGIAFVAVWGTVLITMVKALIAGGVRLQPLSDLDVAVFIYWLAMYGFCLVALVQLGIAASRPLYVLFGIAAAAGTLTLGAMREVEADGKVSTR